MKRICVKPAWEDDLDFQRPANHIDRIATRSVDNGSLGPDNLAYLPPGRIHSYYFSSGIHSQSPSVPSLPESSDLGSEGGRKTDSTTTSSRRFASLRVLVNLFFTALSWIFSEKRILWAFEQYGIILGLSIFGRLWHHLKIALGIQPDKETQSRARSLESTRAEYSPSEDLPQESPREHGHWGPHRKPPLGTTAWEQYHNQDLYSLHDHIESLCDPESAPAGPWSDALFCSVTVHQASRRRPSQIRQEFVDGAIGMEQQHMRARTHRYNFLHRLDAVEWAKMAETEIKTLLRQDSEVWLIQLDHN
ncbi:hypothetical protein LA080_002949 [Diaporthe eres]|nr:hypothetical protein LA080_002949 [Diaporthe eres]